MLHDGFKTRFVSKDAGKEYLKEPRWNFSRSETYWIGMVDLSNGVDSEMDPVQGEPSDRMLKTES